ncbi:3-oxoacyl-[acyl-carrier-protein] reductase FabG [Ruminiclostridium hungatei]|uniref:3-oxoacyl-[acyl-carrier-protein] reductase FabG n=1 Tax=Ruminiclostridium hungatei TaxID=48256 RepID=A0A1V4SKD3_RUMHU|nr:SDR family oxidoreductase [Ruminiclostridium hungatei]OPX43925.1 3-oxoacyl-[acyl-carrier-protein] reductase FabG [Ruminiclostridium hungatei]
MNLDNKVIVVSGSSSGIGKSTAELLLENYANVIGLDSTESSINNERYQHYCIDIRNEQNILTIVDEIENTFEKIDGLANCAGIYSSSKPFFEISFEEWDKVISTNLTGTFLLSKYIARKMIKNKNGKIVNISCIRSRIFRSEMADYSASKGGVVALTSAMALDLKDYNIQVNSVAPGFTYTGMTKESFDNPQEKEFSESIIPVGKIANPKDIANVVLFLFSDLSNYINGETIFVDGGFKISK